MTRADVRGTPAPRRNAARLLLLVVSCAAVAWVWGPAGRATSDSASYLDGARHLAAGEGFVSSHVRIGATAPRPIVDFAPGFSAGIAAAGVTGGLDVHRAAALVIGFAYVVYVAAAYLLLCEVSAARWRWLALLAAVALMLHPAVLQMLDTIGSDLPGAALWAAAVWLTLRLIARPGLDLRQAAGVAALMGLAILVRWSALYLAIALAAGLFVAAAPRWSRGDRLRGALVLLLGALGLAAPWMARNYLATETLVGYRRIHLSNPLAVALDALRGIASGPVDGFAPVAWTPLGTAALLAALPVLALAGRRAWQHEPARLAVVSAPVFVALLVLSAAVSPIDPLHAARFWLPLWPLLGAILLGALATLDAPTARVAVGALALLLAFAAGRFGVAFVGGLDGARTGRDFLQPSLAASAPLHYLRQAGGRTLLSNDPRVVLIHASAPLVHDLPEADLLRPLLRRPVAILLFTQTMTPRIESRLAAQRRMLADLQAEGLASRVAVDPAGEVWLSQSNR